MANPLVVSAPGKVILHGEHAVVYGKTALATSVDLRCYLVLAQTKDDKISLHLPEFVPESDLKKLWSVTELECSIGISHEERLKVLRGLCGIGTDETPSILSMAMLVFLYLLSSIYGERLRSTSGLSATVISNLPAGAGLGSSAAYSVCLAAGFLSYCGIIASPTCSSAQSSSSSGNTLKEVGRRMKAAGLEVGIGTGESCWNKEDLEVINKWGYEAEKLIHGTPSGIDNSISACGGAISFKSGVISHLGRMPSIRILLINTKVPRSTKKMVSGVRERYNKFTSIVSPILESVDNISTTAQALLEDLGQLSDHSTQEGVSIHSQLEELFCLNQHLLNGLGVGHPAIDRVCTLASSLGLSAKLTGGGGGGCVIALLPQGLSDDKLLQLKRSFQEAGFECWETSISCSGATFHSVS